MAIMALSKILLGYIVAKTPRFMQKGTCRASCCATCTKTSQKDYIHCQNPHLTKGDESGRIFKVARAAGDTAKDAELNRKKSKIF